MRKIVGLVLLILLMMCADKLTDDLVICCVGDSIMRPIPSHLKELMSGVERKVVFIEWARGGKTVRRYLNFFKRRFRSRRTVRPDFIIIQLGTNDIRSLIAGEYMLDQFVIDIKEIVNEFMTYSNIKGSPSQVLIANVPFRYDEKFEQLNSYIKEILNPTIEIVAKEEGIYLVDNNRILSNKPHLYSPDGVHPNVTGEKVLAQGWLIAIRKVSRFSKSNSF
jgi:lysophospholipase L1-like esterase